MLNDLKARHQDTATDGYVDNSAYSEANEGLQNVTRYTTFIKPKMDELMSKINELTNIYDNLNTVANDIGVSMDQNRLQYGLQSKLKDQLQSAIRTGQLDERTLTDEQRDALNVPISPVPYTPRTLGGKRRSRRQSKKHARRSRRRRARSFRNN